jgi:SAM-dependent methyltransferase
VFDKAVSVTALEFITQGERTVQEMIRVVKPGGVIVVATLNSLSPWAAGRKKKAEKGHDLFKQAVFRSPEELKSLVSLPCEIRTAVHFGKHEDPDKAWAVEEKGQSEKLQTGAFLVARWEKPPDY